MNSGQVRALLRLRWRMVRQSRSRVGFAALLAIVPVLLGASISAGKLLPSDRSFDLLLLAPTAYLSFAVLAVVGPLVAGGGNELFPAEQLAAFPISEWARYRTSVVLTPLNLAWTAQVCALLGLTTYIASQQASAFLAVVTCCAFIALVTTLGQAVGWAVIGLRTTPRGRIATWAIVGLLAVGVAVVMATGKGADALDTSPTTWVVDGAVSGADGVYLDWLTTTAALCLLAVMADQLGRRSCAWALRRPGESNGRPSARHVRRRTQSRNAHHELLAIDRASVWRSISLRRGLLVLGLLPGVIAAATGLAWSSVVLLPGLVAAGAGLLFGVNAFCLDGSGTIWLAATPARPAVLFWTKVRVVAETCLISVVVTLVATATRASHPPSTGELVAILSCAIVSVLRVVAVCMDLSIRRPFRADLLGPRDTPAPPGVMAAYSARLALSTTLTAVLFSALSQLFRWQWSVALAVVMVLFAARRLIRSSQRWNDDAVRSRVITVVAAG